MSDGDSITINVTGGQQNQVAGKIENKDSHIGDVINSGELTAAKFFEAIESETKQLPEIQSQAVEPLKELATAGQSTNVVTASAQTSALQRYLDILRPHASLIARCTAVFSEQVLKRLAETDPSGVISGVLAVAQEVKSSIK